MTSKPTRSPRRAWMVSPSNTARMTNDPRVFSDAAHLYAERLRGVPVAHGVAAPDVREAQLEGATVVSTQHAQVPS